MFLYLTTTGRRTGLRRDIEIWFTERDGRFYLIAEYRDRASWVRNIRANAQVHVRVGDRRFGALARIVNDEQEPDLARDVGSARAAKVALSASGVILGEPAG